MICMQKMVLNLTFNVYVHSSRESKRNSAKLLDTLEDELTKLSLKNPHKGKSLENQLKVTKIPVFSRGVR